MEDVQQRFISWLIRFGAVSLVLIIGAYFLGRRLRAKANADRKVEPDAKPAPDSELRRDSDTSE